MILYGQRYKISECYSTHNWRICLIEINVGSLREPLCYKSRFVPHHLIVLILLADENPFEFHREYFWRCRYYLREYLPFRERGYFCLDCILPLISVRALFALCHGLRIWIIFEDFSNHCGEINVDNCSLSVI
jgi:hypothetical protein